jgi:hypothetical protein
VSVKIQGKGETVVEISHLPTDLRERALRSIEETRVAGRDTRHNRSANLQAIRGLIRGEPHYTFGIEGVQRFSFDAVLDMVASITGCSKDPHVTTGGGYISPNSTLQGLEAAAERIATVARRGGTFLLGTGHPGSVLLYYLDLGELIRRWGGQILEPQRGALVPPNLDLDYLHGVAVTTDRNSLMHTHDSRAGQLMLAGTSGVDLMVADHGYAGAAINAGVPVVTLMDTNDPAVAVAQHLGADVIIIPLDDNRPLSCYRPIVGLIEELGAPFASSAAANGMPALAAARAPVSAVAPVAPAAVAPASADLQVAERLVAERVSSAAALDQLIYSFLQGYHDQFIQTHFAPDEVVRTEAHPALDLVIYKRLHDALRWATIEQLRLAQSPFTSEQIVAYLERSGPATRNGQ